MKENNTLIHEFLNPDNVFGVIGVSRNPEKYGYKVYKKLKENGYTVYPINPNTQTIDAETCYPDLTSLPQKPDVISIILPPQTALTIVKQAVTQGIHKIWLQPGSESLEILEYAEQHTLDLLHNQCILQQTQPPSTAS
jgi:predicted CoA-binding protein